MSISTKRIITKKSSTNISNKSDKIKELNDYLNLLEKISLMQMELNELKKRLPEIKELATKKVIEHGMFELLSLNISKLNKGEW